MRRFIRVGAIGLGIIAVGLIAVPRRSEVMAQKAQAESHWEYKVRVFSYNPGERLSDEQRAAQFEKSLNDQARQGWEPVGSLLSRTTTQTVGGGVTTRDSISFVGFRRPKQ